jgi:hypothetical protein
VVLELINAGVAELAVVNIAGANNLDETSLITTTAITTAADSANVIYSTTARTSVPFRVVGTIESTQTTAGTWATAPSTIQGAGGQASIPTAMHAAGAAPMFACRAWVNFIGDVAGNFAGGTSTVTRIAAATLCTVTTTTPHNLITGHYIYAATGVAADVYVVTYVSALVFTFNTVATTALTAVSITFDTRNILAGGNVSSISNNGTGNVTVNFSVPLIDANYVLAGSGEDTGASGDVLVGRLNGGVKTTVAINLKTLTAGSVATNFPNVNVIFFR